VGYPLDWLAPFSSVRQCDRSRPSVSPIPFRTSRFPLPKFSSVLFFITGLCPISHFFLPPTCGPFSGMTRKNVWIPHNNSLFSPFGFLGFHPVSHFSLHSALFSTVFSCGGDGLRPFLASFLRGMSGQFSMAFFFPSFWSFYAPLVSHPPRVHFL